MTRPCPRCDESELPERSRYCLACGAELASDTAARAGHPGEAPYTPPHLRREVLTRRDALEGERKEVTVLVADVAGSLAMAAALDPEDVHAVMNGFFAIALEAVHAEGGTVNQFRGDGFMALFGAPRARGDDAARALRAALDIRQRGQAYGASVRARFGIPFVLRMGVNTGLVWVGAIGADLRHDYTAEGPTVGVAARLEEAASPGQILVGGETARRCGAYFELAALGPRPVRGLDEPVQVFELVGPGRHRERLAVERARGLTPFVGREQELRRLIEATEPRAGVRLVEVRGEAGIGKSRLVLECLDRLPATTRVLPLGCRESYASRAYLPWLELLRAWPERIPRPARLDSVIRRLEGRETSEGSASGDVANDLRAVIREAGSAGPLVVVIEDAQWLDPSSRAVVRRLDSPSGSLTVILTRRDEGDPDWFDVGSLERIRLAPLRGAEVRELAASILREVEDPEPLMELALRRGGGNPLFVEEVARSLRDGPEPTRRAARLEISLLRAPSRTPETLHGVVAARIDALPETSKRLLEAAAVLGQPAPPELLTELEPAPDGDPSRAVATLVEQGLLRATESGRLDFHHGVVREVAYEQLIRERRAGLHGRAADALAKRPEGRTTDGASRIGVHYDRAGEVERAIAYLSRAGRGYSELAAPAEATAHLRRAWELLRAGSRPDPSAEVSVGLLLASCLNATDRAGEAAAVLEAIEETRSDPSDRLRLAMASIQAGWVRFSEDQDVARGRRLVQRGLAVAEGVEGGEQATGAALAYLSRMLLLDGEAEEAAHCARRLAELSLAAGNAAGLVLALYNESAALCEVGLLAKARAAAAQALEVSRDTRNDLLASLADVAMAKIHLYQGDTESALAAADRGFSEASRAGQVGVQYMAVVYRGHAQLLAGDPVAALGEFDRLAQLNDRWPVTFLHRARGHLEVGHFDAAVDLAQRCLALAPAHSVRGRALAVLGLALGLADPGERERAEELLAESISLFDRLELKPFLAESRRFLGELLMERGEKERAEYYGRRAIEEFEQCGMPAHAEEARRSLGPLPCARRVDP